MNTEQQQLWSTGCYNGATIFDDQNEWVCEVQSIDAAQLIVKAANASILRSRLTAASDAEAEIERLRNSTRPVSQQTIEAMEAVLHSYERGKEIIPDTLSLHDAIANLRAAIQREKGE